MENFSLFLFGVLLSVLGIVNIMGNISTIHSYNRRRVKEEDIPRYGKLVGTGTLIMGASLIAAFIATFCSGVYAIQDNGAWTLRCIVYQVFGASGAVLLAAIFTLACLTTCVGLINSISQYFSTLFGKLSYNAWTYIIIGFSFLICNMGLSTILSISVPVLNAIYPVAIVLILLGLSDRLWRGNRFAYPLCVAGTAVVSVIYALDNLGLSLGALTLAFRRLPLYNDGFGWFCVAVLMLLVSAPLNAAVPVKKKEKCSA